MEEAGREAALLDGLSAFAAPNGSGRVHACLTTRHHHTAQTFGPEAVPSTFAVGSVTKGITGTVTAELAVRGLISLDDLVGRFLPRTAGTAVGRITIGQLASHTSGLPRRPARGNDRDGVLADLETLEVGPATYRYSHFGFIVLAWVLEVAAASDFGHLVRELVTEPLGMHVTFDADSFAGATGMRTSCADLTVLAEALARPGATALARALRLATAPHAAADAGRTGDEPRRAVGMGWRLLEHPILGRLIWHNAREPGCQAFVAVAPERDAAIVVLADHDGAGVAFDQTALQALQHAALLQDGGLVRDDLLLSGEAR